MAIPVGAISNDANSIEVCNGRFTFNLSLQETIDNYFSARNTILKGSSSNQPIDLSSSAKSALSSVKLSQEVAKKEESRTQVSQNMATYHNVHLVDSQTIFSVLSASKNSNTLYNVVVYEWVWIEYNDGKNGAIDKMGYGTNHQMTIELQADGSIVIVKDIYDDSDMTGIPQNSTNLENVISPSQTVNVAELTPDIDIYASTDISNFNISSLKTYANRYVSPEANGGSDYLTYNYTQYGYFENNDCANYVSQCLHAGGLPISTLWRYIGPVPANYKNPTNAATLAWKGAISLYNYLTTTLGYSSCAYEQKNISPGNPIFTRVLNENGQYEINHTAICVGYDNENVPIFNSHTNDRYHVRFSFFSGVSPLVVQCMSFPYPQTSTLLHPVTAPKQQTCQMSSVSDEYFMLEVSSTNTYTFYTSKLSSNVSLNGILYKYDTNNRCMQPINTDTNGGNISFQATLPAGVYFLRVSGTSSTVSGFYYLNYYRAS